MHTKYIEYIYLYLSLFKKERIECNDDGKCMYILLYVQQ